MENNVTATYNTDLFITNNFDNNFQHFIDISDNKLKSIKLGENLTDDIILFYLLELLTTSPSIKSISNKNSNFIIIYDKFLNENFIDNNQNSSFNCLKVILRILLLF